MPFKHKKPLLISAAAIVAFGYAMLACSSSSANQLSINSEISPKQAPNYEVKVQPLTPVEQQKLLNSRFAGSMGGNFERFANMFIVSSIINLERTVGLMTSSQKIEAVELVPAFPTTYEPTVREFLDAISMQTASSWKYDPTGKFIRADKKQTKPLKGVAIFEFSEEQRVKPYQITLAKDWKQIDRGGWVMCVPSKFPVGMDIYECGTFSADDQDKQSELFKKLPAEIALDWAKRVKPDAKLEDLKATKVGEYPAYLFDTMLPSKDGQQVRWRNWSFLVGNKGYTIISTIFPELEEQIFPDVEAMLKTFRTNP